MERQWIPAIKTKILHCYAVIIAPKKEAIHGMWLSSNANIQQQQKSHCSLIYELYSGLAALCDLMIYTSTDGKSLPPAQYLLCYSYHHCPRTSLPFKSYWTGSQGPSLFRSLFKFFDTSLTLTYTWIAFFPHKKIHFKTLAVLITSTCYCDFLLIRLGWNDHVRKNAG